MTEFLKKELRALVVPAVLIGLFYAAFILYWLGTEFPDQGDFPKMASSTREELDKSDQQGKLYIAGLLSVVVGANLLMGERAAGTQRFLDALPVTRTRIFLAKVVAALLVLALFPAPMFLLKLLALIFSGNLANFWSNLALTIAPFMVLAYCFLSVTLVLSFFGSWFPMAAGFSIWGFLWLRSRQIAGMGLLDPSEFLSCPTFSWAHAAALLGVSSIFLTLAWMGFQVQGDRLEHPLDRLGRLRFAPIFRFLCFALTSVVWIGVVYQQRKIAPSKSEEGVGISAHEKFFGSHQTGRYHFAFREMQREKAQKLFAAADAVHDRVTDFFQADPMPVPIVVDLAQAVDPRAAGVTNWSKIRIPLEGKPNLEFLKVVLGHETAHVYIDQLSKGVLHRNFQSARFFHEGLATLVEHRLFSTPEERRRMRRVAAFAHSRGRIAFDTLADDSALREKRDDRLAYPLGEIFCDALVSAHGVNAPGILLRACAKASPDLKGVEFWRKTLQSCGFDLEHVIAGYDAGLESAAVEEAEFVSRFPKSTAAVEIVGDSIVIHRDPAVIPSAQPVFELPTESGVMPQFSVQKDGSIRISRSSHTNPKLRYQLGWSSKEARLPLFEPWVEVDLNALPSH